MGSARQGRGPEHHRDLDYLVEMLDWDAKSIRISAPTTGCFRGRCKPFDRTEAEGYREQWVAYGTSWYSAKELTVLPKRSVQDQGRRRIWIDRHAGLRPLRTASVCTPSMIRYGQMTEDELFVMRRRGSGRRDDRESQLLGSAGHPETLWPGESGEPHEIGARAEAFTEGTSMHRLPKLHNAMWPGLVGKGSPGAEPASNSTPCSTSRPRREVNGADSTASICSSSTRTSSIDATDDEMKKLADKIAGRGFVVGSLVAPVWPPTGGGRRWAATRSGKNS